MAKTIVAVARLDEATWGRFSDSRETLSLEDHHRSGCVVNLYANLTRSLPLLWIALGMNASLKSAMRV